MIREKIRVELRSKGALKMGGRRTARKGGPKLMNRRRKRQT
jgi:hypothetical protein